MGVWGKQLVAKRRGKRIARGFFFIITPRRGGERRLASTFTAKRGTVAARIS